MELLNPLDGAQFASATVAFTGTAGSTSTYPSGPEGVVVWTDSPCYVVVGEGVTATVAGTPIPAYTPIPFKVPRGTGAPWRVSAIQIGVAGNLYVKPLIAQ